MALKLKIFALIFGCGVVLLGVGYMFAYTNFVTHHAGTESGRSHARGFLDNGKYRLSSNEKTVGEPLILLTDVTRTLHEKNRKSMKKLMIYGILAALIFFSFVWLILNASIFKRIRSLETKLEKSQKVATLGLLAGGVAHDLNNMLGPVVAYPEIIKSKILSTDPIFRYIDAIEVSALKSAAIVSDMLTLTRRSAIKKEVMSLNNVVALFLLTPEFEKMKFFHQHVRFATHQAPDLLSMHGSPLYISRAVMNLVSNAAEAIEGAGTVTIATTNRILANDIDGYEKVPANEYVVLSVSDTGAGIEPSDFHKIFEPFYTKKVMGRSGTGLGMAIVWSAIKDSQGYLNIISNKSGTTFELYFAASHEPVPLPSVSAVLDPYIGNGETVLVIDDVKEQCETASTMLSELAYNVRTVCSGEEGVECIKRQQIDIVILDMIMDPGIDGLETLTRIRSIRKDQRIIIASGYAETERVKKARERGAYFLKKPFRMDQLGNACKSILSPRV